MAVGMVVEQPVAEPDDALEAEVALQPLLDLRRVEAGVAVGVEQALLGGEDGARSVAVDRAAFEDPVGRGRAGRPRRSEALADRVVAGQVIFAAPAVEGEVDCARRSAPLPRTIAPVSRSQMSPNGSTITLAKGARRARLRGRISSAATSHTSSPAPSAWTAAANAATSAWAGARSSSHSSASLGKPIHTASCGAHSGRGGWVMARAPSNGSVITPSEACRSLSGPRHHGGHTDRGEFSVKFRICAVAGLLASVSVGALSCRGHSAWRMRPGCSGRAKRLGCPSFRPRQRSCCS